MAVDGKIDENVNTIHVPWDHGTDQVFTEVWSELERAKVAHPRYPDDPLRRICLIGEEFGEAMKEAVDYTRPKLDREFAYATRKRLYDELVQTAAMTVRMLVEMRKEGGI